MSLGSRLRRLRHERGLSLEKAAAQLGIHFSTLAGYERDKRNPEPERLQHLANFYGVSVDWLLGRTEQRDFYAFPKEYKINSKLMVYETPISSNLLYNSSLKDWIDFLTQTLTRSGITLAEQDRRQIAEIAMFIVNMLISQKLMQGKPPNA